MKTRIILSLLALALVFGPWAYAAAAVSANPLAGKDGGVWEGATYLSVLTVPAALVLAVCAITLRPRW